MNRELRNKLGHAHFANQPHPEEQPGQPHGMDAVSHNKHLQMAEAIADCEATVPWHGHGRLREHEGARHPSGGD